MVKRANTGVRSLKVIGEDYDIAYAKMTKIVNTAKAENRDLTPAEVAEFDSVDAEIRALAAEKSQAEREHEETLRVFNSPDFASRLPEALRGNSGGGDGLRSPSGKPIAVARGPKERLNKSPISGHLIGELARAAAIGVTAYTPEAVKMELRSDENSKGGFAVPDGWLSTWIDKAIEFTSVAQYCTRQLMDTESLNVTTIESRPTLETKAQLAKFAATGIVFGNRRLEAFTAGGLMLASLEMLEDSPNAGQQVEAVAMRSIVDWLNDRMLNGTGSQQPLGVLNREDLPGDTSVGDITWDALADAVSALRDEVYVPNACIVSPSVYNALNLQRELTAGDGAYLPRPQHLEDLNVVPSSHCPDDRIVMGDFTQLMLGVRQGARVEVSPHGEAFEKNAMAIRLKLRVDWVPLHTAAFYTLSGVTVPS